MALHLTTVFKSKLLFGQLNVSQENFSTTMVRSMMEHPKNDFFEVVQYVLEHPSLYEDPLIFVANHYYGGSL